MNKYKTLIKLFIVIAFYIHADAQTVSMNNYNRMSFNTIRIAYWDSYYQLNDTFLAKAQENKYNYVLFCVDRIGDPVSGHWKSKKEIFNHIKNGFISANKYQIRIIPFIQMGSHWVDWCSQPGKEQTSHSTGWQKNGVAWKQERLWVKGNYRCPAMADETGIDGGIDDIFTEFLKLIKDAYDSSAVEYPLEFIHLGHDEAWDNPGPTIDEISICYGVTQKSDQLYINKMISTPFKYTLNEAYYLLVWDELLRRINQVKNNIDRLTKIIIFADMFDPEHDGGEFDFRTFLSKIKVNKARPFYDHTIRFVPVRTVAIEGILALQNININDKKNIRENIVLQPWSYTTIRFYQNGKMHYYLPKYTFNYFKNNGFKFIYTAAFTDLENDGTGDGLIDDSVDNIKAMNNYANESIKFYNNCLGYSSMQFGKAVANKQELMQKEMYEKNRNRIPNVDYIRDNLK